MNAYRLRGLWVFYFIFLTASAGAETERASFVDAEKLFMQGRYDSAIRESERLIGARSSERDEVYYIKGLSELKMDKFTEARESFETILSKYPGSRRTAETYIGIGDSYFLEGSMEPAIKSYEEVLSRFPDDKNVVSVYYKLGNSYKNRGYVDKSEYYYDKVRNLYPLSFEARMISGGPYRNINVRTDVPGGEVFSVQVGSFKNRANAERMARKLYNSGYDSFMEISPGARGNLYRVKVGKYKSKKEADAVAVRLRNQGYSTKVI